MSVRYCEECSRAERVAGERYCAECRKKKLREMNSSGYLQRVPINRDKYRTDDDKEDQRETKTGVWRAWEI